MCLAIFNTEVEHAVSDHYALNYRHVFSPSACHAALALIRGAHLRLTHTDSPSAHIWQVMSLTEETALDTYPDSDHQGVTLVNDSVVVCIDLRLHNDSSGQRRRIIQLLIDLISLRTMQCDRCLDSWSYTCGALIPVAFADSFMITPIYLVTASWEP